MKAIKIKVPVNLTSGLTTPSNTILTIAEGYTNNKSKVLDQIPAQISTLLYLNSAAIETKDAITGIADFNPVFLNLQLSVANFETKTAETLLIDAVYDELLPIYSALNLEIIII
jgi:hypothetical protein